jgi:hypothetical protein
MAVAADKLDDAATAKDRPWVVIAAVVGLVGVVELAWLGALAYLVFRLAG